MLFAVKWWFFAELLSLAALPVCLCLFRNLPDKGYPFSKLLGIAGFSYLSWILASLKLFPFDPQALFPVLCLLSILCWIVFLKTILKKISEIYRIILFSELIFLIVFVLFTVLRSFDPNIFGAEKFMDFAFLNSTLRAQYFPPADPWFSAGSIDFYYYFGYVMMATLTKLANVPSSISYNLSIGLLGALIFTGAFSILYNLTKSRFCGILGGIFLCIAGNLDGLRQLFVKGFSAPFDYWASSRIIPGTINEFPLFTLLHADLHPHLIGLPLTLLVLAICLNIFKAERTRLRQDLGYCVLLLIILSLCVGIVAVTNLFDLPTYALIIFAAIFLFFLRSGKGIRSLYLAVVVFLFVLAAAIGCCQPFFAHYHSQFRGFGLVDTRTMAKDTLIIFGLFLYCMITFIFSYYLTKFKKPGAKINFGLGVIIALVAAGVLLILIQTQAIFGLVILGACLAWMLVKEWRDGGLGFVLILAFFSLAILTACETFFIKDAYVFEQRMNTVFKYYFQAWVLLSLSASYFVWVYFKKIKSARLGWLRLAWVLGFVFLFCASLIYPFAASYAKCSGFRVRPTLDGSAYLEKSNFSDYGMIRWLKEHARQDTVILEATGEPYTYFSRISAHTGLPTVLGWANHEWVWRPWEESIGRRELDIKLIYQSTDVSVVRPLVQQYRINYICVGGLERQAYDPIGLSKLSSFLQVVYECQDAVIYEVTNT